MKMITKGAMLSWKIFGGMIQRIGIILLLLGITNFLLVAPWTTKTIAIGVIGFGILLFLYGHLITLAVTTSSKTKKECSIKFPPYD